MKLAYSLIISGLIMAGCGSDKNNEQNNTDSEQVNVQERTEGYNEDRNAYFGNVHIHTSYSFDGYTNKCITGPADAYRWAKGESIPGGGGGGDLKIKVPLDFYAVSDHAEWLGVFKMMEDPESPLSKLEIAKYITSPDPAVSFKAFADLLYAHSTGGAIDPALSDTNIIKSIWKEIVETADTYYEPGKFTTFPAFEWSSNPNTRNLHRVVVFGNTENVPSIPFSSHDSEDPEALWDWMDQSRQNGATLLAIPHNANASDGLMFSLTNWNGDPISSQYSETRMRNEPIYEMSQIKGTSETHPDLSPNDEFANFEQWDYTLAATADRPTHREGSFIRKALMDGIQIQKQGNGNPFKYGVIGDSDSHNSAASVEEDNYTGKFAIENKPEHRLNGPLPDEKNNRQVREFSSGGLAGVWAEENTRESIFNAMHRKETFGTSGTRLKIRFFGGYNYDAADISNDGWVHTAYEKGIPMGGDLPAANGKNPTFIIYAIKESNGANLDRAQVIKGWVDDSGKQHEKIFNVALSDNRVPNAKGIIPPVGNTVDIKNASYTNDIGDVEFLITWTDPEFSASQYCFYYVRVLEIPTPRWSTYDAKTLGIDVRKDLPATIQERGWSSPIWYTPQ